MSQASNTSNESCRFVHLNQGDDENPKGGVRQVIPQNTLYTIKPD